MPKFNSKKEWLTEARRLKATGLTAQEVAAQVGEFSPQPGQRYSIHNSSKNGVVAVDMEARLARGNKRTQMERSQSLGIGDTEMPRNTTSKTKKAENRVFPGMELHHRNSLIQNTPFYDGLSDKEAREFTSWTRQQGWDLGNSDGNTNIPLKISKHKSIHAWMRENGVEGARGPQKRLTEGMQGMSLADRKYAFRNYMAYVQKGVDEHMVDAVGDVSISSKHETAQKNNLRIVEKQNEVERLKKNIGNIESGPRAGQRLPVNRRTLGDAIISDSLGRKARKYVPILGAVGALTNAGNAFAQGNHAEGAVNIGEAVLGELPGGDLAIESISGSPVADATITGRRAAINQTPNKYGAQGPDVPTPEQFSVTRENSDIRNQGQKELLKMASQAKDWFKSLFIR